LSYGRGEDAISHRFSRFSQIIPAPFCSRWWSVRECECLGFPVAKPAPSNDSVRPQPLRADEEFMNRIIDAIEKEQEKSDVTLFSVGDSVRVHTRVVEGDKERIQIFTGVVIGRKGRGLNETFTVRRISYGEGVERVFPLHSPRVAKVEVEQQGRARRAKLNYLRTRKGKEATAVRE